MGQIALQVPVSGLPNSTEDPRIVSDFTAIQTLLNGGIDATNIAPGAAIEDSKLGPIAASATWKVYQRASALIVSPFAPGSTYIYTPAGLVVSGSSASVAPVMFTLNSIVDAVPTGRTIQVRVQLVVATNAIAPAITLTTGMYPLGFGGASGTFVATVGALFGTLNTALASPAANTYTSAISAPVVITAANNNNAYGFGLTASAVQTSGSTIAFTAELHARYV
jgi:hypothetical protein